MYESKQHLDDQDSFSWWNWVHHHVWTSPSSSLACCDIHTSYSFVSASSISIMSVKFWFVEAWQMGHLLHECQTSWVHSTLHHCPLPLFWYIPILLLVLHLSALWASSFGSLKLDRWATFFMNVKLHEFIPLFITVLFHYFDTNIWLVIDVFVAFFKSAYKSRNLFWNYFLFLGRCLAFSPQHELVRVYQLVLKLFSLIRNMSCLLPTMRSSQKHSCWDKHL
jgi:hypothetical protein